MRFMVVVKANAGSEAGVMPDAELIEQMDKYNSELIAAGVMLDGAGLRPSSQGVRVNFDGLEPTVIDGPFAETKELIAGYWIWNCKDLADAIAWLKKAPFKEGELELRPFFEPEDFAGVASEEIIEKEKGWRDAQARGASIASTPAAH
jgi:hypothetical protein